MKKQCVIAILCIGAVFASNCLSDDLLPPSWRGAANTTFQAWEFDYANIPADLTNGWLNPYGTPTAEVIGIDGPPPPPPQTYWKNTDYGHQGVWRIYGEDYMQLWIPNDPVARPLKEIWLQMTYYASGVLGANPEISTWPSSKSMELISKQQLDSDYYYHAVWKLTIEPNPDSEWIWIQPRDCTIYIDEIVVDTICIPEPATITLLGLACLLLRKKRR